MGPVLERKLIVGLLLLAAVFLVGCGNDNPGVTDKSAPKGGPVSNGRHPPGLNEKNLKNY